MKFYTNNPISIVSCLAAIGNNITEIVFVFPDSINRGQGITKHYLDVLNSRYSASLRIANKLKIKISTVTWYEFNQNIADVELVDAHLSRKQILHKHTIIMQPSDSYCAFGFSELMTFTRNKIKLKNYWRRNLNFNNDNNFYAFGDVRDKLNSRNILYIDLKLSKDLLQLVSSEFIREIELKYNINENSQYLLALPPYIKNIGADFNRVFFDKIKFLAAKDNLEVIIKPHRNDDILNFPDEFTNKSIIDYSDAKYMFAEFFFLIPNIKRIVSVPSSALVYADFSKLITYVPKNKRIFQKNFLDQICFLNSVGINYSKI